MTTQIDQEFVDGFRRPATQGNWVRNMNPINIALILISLTLIPVIIPGNLAPAAMCFAYIGIALAAGVARAFMRTYLKLFLVVGLVLFILRAAFVPGTQVLFTLGPISPTLEGVDDGLRFSLVVMVFSGAVTLYFAVVPIKYLMLALELRGLTPHATYVILASFQSIIDLGKNARVVLEAQKSRGIETDGSLLTRVRAFFPILAPVFLAAMNQTEERAIALDARAFNSDVAHSHLVTLRRTRPWEIFLLVCAIIGVAISTLGVLLSWF